MMKSLILVAVTSMVLAGCNSVPTSAINQGAQVAPAPVAATSATYRVLGGEQPAPVETTAPEPMPEQPQMPVAPVLPVAPCIDCGTPLDAVLSGYDFNRGNGIPFGYRDVLYDASPWVNGFGHDLYPYCGDCAVPVPVPVPVPAPKGKNH